MGGATGHSNMRSVVKLWKGNSVLEKLSKIGKDRHFENVSLSQKGVANYQDRIARLMIAITSFWQIP